MACSVVIPCHNGADLTRACLASLLQQHGALLAEIVLVDNGCTDETAELTALDPRVRIVQLPHNRGFAGGVNAGVATCRQPLVLVLNNDTQAANNLLVELHRALECDPRIAAVAPVSNHVKGPGLLPIGDLGRDPAQREQLARALADHAPIQDVDMLAGLCLLMRRSTFDSIGGFDERFGHGNYEDDDLSLRLRLRGHRLVIARRAFLHHEGHATFRALGLSMPEQLAQRMRQFVTKWRLDPAGRAMLAGQRGDVDSSGRDAATARSRYPEWPDADLLLAQHRIATGLHAEALPHLRAFLASCPEHVQARLDLAMALLHTGQPRAGQQELARLARTHGLSPRDEARAHRELAELRDAAGDHAAAGDLLRAAVELQPNDGALHNRLGLALLAAGNLEPARAAFVAATSHGHHLAHTNLGICAARAGSLHAAGSHFERAVALLPQDPVARANYEAWLGAMQATAGAPATKD